VAPNLEFITVYTMQAVNKIIKIPSKFCVLTDLMKLLTDDH